MVLEYNSWKPFQQQNGFGYKFGEEGTKKKIGRCMTNFPSLIDDP
jgi:hypothetical protein